MNQERPAERVIQRTFRALGLVFVTLLIVLQPAFAFAGQARAGRGCPMTQSGTVALRSAPSARGCCCCSRMSPVHAPDSSGPRIGRLPSRCRVAPAPRPDASRAGVTLGLERTASQRALASIAVAYTVRALDSCGHSGSLGHLEEAPPPPAWSSRSASSGAWTLESDGLRALLALFAVARN